MTDDEIVSRLDTLIEQNREIIRLLGRLPITPIAQAYDNLARTPMPPSGPGVFGNHP